MSGGDLPRVLVVGIGNTDRGDDGVGPAVAQRLRGRVPPAVGVLECRGDALTLLDDWAGFATVILVDAVAPVDEPGRVHRIDLATNSLPLGFAPPSTHAFGLAEAVELARSLQRLPPRLVAYLVEAEQFDTGTPFSPILAKAVEDVVERISAELSAMVGTLQVERTLFNA